MLDRSGRKTAGAARCALAAALVLVLAAGCSGARIPGNLFAAGRIGEFPMASQPRQVQSTNIFVLHDESGYAAIAGECRYDQCAVEAKGSDGFVCPCCGSRYAVDGTVTGGPATQDLKWFEVLLVENELQIDPTVEVPKGRYMPATNQ